MIRREYPFLQGVIEIYNLHGSRLKANHAIFFLDTLQEIAMHAHKGNADSQLRSKLQKLQMLTQLPEPPFLRLENESYLAYLTILQNLTLQDSYCKVILSLYKSRFSTI